MLDETSISCPYCGEMLDILVDGSAGDQDYIEDCQVCCRPMNVHIRFDGQGAATVDARHEDEV